MWAGRVPDRGKCRFRTGTFPGSAMIRYGSSLLSRFRFLAILIRPSAAKEKNAHGADPQSHSRKKHN